MGDLDPAMTERLVDWLKNYDPADGVHEIGHGEAPYSVEDTVAFMMAASSISRIKKIIFLTPQYMSHYSLWTISEPNDTRTAACRISVC